MTPQDHAMDWLQGLRQNIAAGKVADLAVQMSAASAAQRQALQQCPDTLLSPSARLALATLATAGVPEPESLHARAALYLEGGHTVEAERMVGKALEAAPTAMLWNDLGNVRVRAGNLHGAHEAFTRAVQTGGDNAAILFSAGSFFYGAGLPAEAVPVLERACRLAPKLFGAWLDFGNALKDIGRFDEALSAYGRALEIEPSAAEALNNRATVLKHIGRVEEALRDWSAAITAQPEHLFAFLNRGALLSDLGRPEHALADFEQAVAIAPDNPHAHYGLAECLHRTGLHEEAMAALLPAELLFGNSTGPHLTRGNCLQALGEFEAAINAYARCIEIDPDYVDAYINWGNALQELNHHDEAIDVFGRALAKRPDFTGARWNRANSLLIQGLTPAAWQDYEGRHQLGAAARVPAGSPPLIGNGNLDGKRLLLLWDQRYGDIIHALRYVPEVERRAGSCIWQIAPALQALFAASFPHSRMVAPNEIPAGLELTVPITSLPWLLGAYDLPDNPANVAHQMPYLAPPANRLAHWTAVIGGDLPAETKPDIPNIALCWRGQPVPHGRSIPLTELRPLFVTGPACLHALQLDATAQELRLLEHHGIRHYGTSIHDFADTAAILSRMDLVITIDTAVAHLAAALGKPVRVLLKHGNDWRWITISGSRQARWYPTAQVFRQTTPRDWYDVVRDALDI